MRWLGCLQGWTIQDTDPTFSSSSPSSSQNHKKNITRIILEIWGLKNVGKCWNLRPMLLAGLTLYWDRWFHPPAELTNPSQLVTPSWIYVCACLCVHVSPKKKKKLASLLWWRWWMDLFWFWNMMGSLLACPPRVRVCAHAYNHLFLENDDAQRNASVFSWLMLISWLAWQQHVYWGDILVQRLLYNSWARDYWQIVKAALLFSLFCSDHPPATFGRCYSKPT